MDTFIDRLVENAGQQGAFKPVARYFPEMDFLIYLKKDCSYRAKRVDAFLTVLYDPYEEKLVGVKLKGFKFLFERFRAVSKLDLKDSHFVELTRVLEIAMVGGLGESMMDSYRHQRSQELWEEARNFVAANDPKFAVEELAQAA